jgi:hypothetical protein
MCHKELFPVMLCQGVDIGEGIIIWYTECLLDKK